jgi:hypothetical protein
MFEITHFLLEKMTVKEYDLSEWSSQFKQTLFPLALIVGLHFYIGFVQPLIIQSIIPLKALYSTPLFQVCKYITSIILLMRHILY